MHEHFELLREPLRLVHAARASLADIKLLERHHIRVGARNDLRDAPGLELPIRPDAAMHVVGE